MTQLKVFPPAHFQVGLLLGVLYAVEWSMGMLPRKRKISSLWTC